MLGIVSVRGRVTTVIDLRRRLRLSEGPVTKQTRVLLVESGDEIVGLLVDQVLQVFRLRDDEVEIAAVMGGDVAEHVLGIGRPEGLRNAAKAPVGSQLAQDWREPPHPSRLADTVEKLRSTWNFTHRVIETFVRRTWWGSRRAGSLRGRHSTCPRDSQPGLLRPTASRAAVHSRRGRSPRPRCSGLLTSGVALDYRQCRPRGGRSGLW